MPRDAPIYDLLLLLSTGATPEQQAKILEDVETAISSGGGTIERKADWGLRTLTYQIAHQPEANYHLLQFSGSPTLLESLSHSLRVADGVLRFRIIKVTPGTPPAPESVPPVIATPRSGPPTPGRAVAAARPPEA